jgi:hypothetical protein
MGPIVLAQMQEKPRRNIRRLAGIDEAETANTDDARLRAYEALRQIVSWLAMGA